MLKRHIINLVFCLSLPYIAVHHCGPKSSLSKTKGEPLFDGPPTWTHNEYSNHLGCVYAFIYINEFGKQFKP